MQDQPQFPPNSKESEMMVLGCMLNSITSLNVGADSLEAGDFYFTEHQTIFECLKCAHRNDQPADIHLIAEELKRQQNLQSVGGVAYLTTLAQYVGTSAYTEEYVDVVKKKALSRRILQAGQDAVQIALNDPSDPELCLHDLQDKLRQIEKHGSTRNKIKILFLSELEKDYLLVEPLKKPMLLNYCPPGGFVKGFLPKGIVAMLVGAGGVGKTHLTAQLAISVASDTPFLDVFRTTEHCGEARKGNVFIGLGENQYDDIHRVLFKAAKKIRQMPGDIIEENLIKETSKRIAVYSFCGQDAAFIVDGKPTRYFREFKMRLIDSAPTGGWDLIILDPVSRLLGADAEVDNAAATQFIALLEELTIDLPGNPTVLFAHHVNKASQQKEEEDQGSARGASALSDGVRWQINFKKVKDSEISSLTMTKSNFTAITEKIHTKKDHDGFIEFSKEIPPLPAPYEKKKQKKIEQRSYFFPDED